MIHYLDNAATTRCRDAVLDAMIAAEKSNYGNPSSPHMLGISAARTVSSAIKSIADLINCQNSELTITSGATESNNIVILGCVQPSGPGNIIVCPIDHKSTIEAAAWLEGNGVDVRRMRLSRAGVIDVEHLRGLVDSETKLVTLSLVNSEIGVVQPIESIKECLIRSNAILHVDASQAVGKIPMDMEAGGIGALSLSAHKIGGPKGVGALFVRRDLEARIKPLTFGGGQFRLRSGTIPTQLLAGFGVAASLLSRSDFDANFKNVSRLRSAFLEALTSSNVDYELNCPLAACVPSICNIWIKDVRAEAVIKTVSSVCVASGSACNSRSMLPSPVLTGIGLSPERANCSIRVSFGIDNTEAEVADAARAIGVKVHSHQTLAKGGFRDGI